jgi:conjugal transfer pilus assembly protein TraL
MNSDNKYFICKRLDEPKRYVGLTLDEFVPIAIVNAVCFFLGSIVTGFAISGGLWLLLKHFKKGQGPGWFLNLLYWHLPLHYLQGVIFVKTPPASLRHWLS